MLGILVVCAAVLVSGTWAQHDSESTTARTRPSGAPPLPEIPGTGPPPVPEGALFVSTSGTAGARGTRSDPLRTLGEAVRTADQAATIVLRSGTYRESIGVVRKRLHIRSYPGERVWLKGSEVVETWEPTGRGWMHEGWSPDFCRDCFIPEIVDPRHPDAGLADMVFLDGEPLRQVTERAAVTEGTFFVDPDEETLLIGNAPEGRTVEAATRSWLLQFDGPRAAGSSLRGIGVAHYASRQEYGREGAMVVVNSAEVTLEGNAFSWAASSGAAVFAPGARVVDNVFSDNGLVGMMANRADGIRMSGNLVARNNREHFALSGPAIGAAGVKITRTARPVIRRNSFVDNTGSGWWCDLGCTNAVVLGNTTRGNVKHGLFYEVSSDALIASNLIAENRGLGVKISSADRVRVLHNTFLGNRGAVGLYNDVRSPSSDPYSDRLGLSWITAGTELVNNHFAGTAAGHPFATAKNHKPGDVPTPGFVSRSDGNVYVRGEEPHLVDRYLGSGRSERFETLPELTAETGQGRHSTVVRASGTPFRDPEEGDYRLRPNAPGTDAGRPVPGEVTERLGTSPDDHPDVGILVRPGRP
ncbi:right-handed parallel beta-helix repeat-containing protein [Actinopolyspora halophila]|uniref:right-handed parallel beta-helix repeat-containing protein n=1 Tax=Actinopolyspora halophila TaxID=1850 RepID=UPI00036D4695|nr:right-handed parallel beta-helix repeat-containing protein [Actinopolyspora halophila]